MNWESRGVWMAQVRSRLGDRVAKKTANSLFSCASKRNAPKRCDESLGIIFVLVSS